MQRLYNINYTDAIIILLGMIRLTSEIVYIMLISVIKCIIFKIYEFRKSFINYFILMFTEIKIHFTHNFSADLNVLSRNLPCNRIYKYNLSEERVTLVIRFYEAELNRNKLDGFIIHIIYSALCKYNIM